MSGRGFDRVVTLLLLGLGLWYLVTMLSYPAGAGRIPAIAAAAFIAALVVQLLASFRTSASDQGSHHAASSASPTAGIASAAPTAKPHEGGGPGAPHVDAVAPPDIEPDSYDTLIRLSGARRRLFLGIATWAVLFYVGALAVGFVATFAVLFTGLLLYVRERPVVAVAAGLVSGLAMYAFVAVFLRLPAFSGFLFS